MMPISLSLKGWTAIKAGLGRDELFLDLEKLTDGAQLVALVGPNGIGKTSILEHLQPYRILPSRSASYSPAAVSLYDHIYGPEASKVLEWEHGEKRYRTTLLFKQTAKTKKTECYLHVEVFGEWTTVTLPDGTASDGKTETYDRCVEHVLGSAEMFFNAAFSAQGRRPLSSYTNGDIKGLLSELLGLNQVADLGVKANQVTKLLRARLDTMRDDLLLVETRETELTDAERDLEGLPIIAATEARQNARHGVAKATRHLSEVQADANANAGIEIRRNTLTTQLNSANQRKSAVLRQTDTDMQAERQRAASAIEATHRDEEHVTGQITVLDKQVTDWRALLDRKGDIEAAQANAAYLATQEAEGQAAVATLKVAAEDFRVLLGERDRIAASLDGLAREGVQLKATCDGLTKRAALAESVPCQGTDLQGRCTLLRDAVTAKSEIPAATVNVATKRAAWTAAHDRLVALRANVDAQPNPMRTLEDAEHGLTAVQVRIRQNDSLVAMAPAVAQAEQALASAEQQRVGLQAVLEEKQREQAKVTAELDARLRGLVKRRQEAQTEAETDIVALQAELAALPAPADTSALEAAEAAVAEADAALTAAERSIEDLNARGAALKERIRAIKVGLRDAVTIKEAAGRLETEISHWSLLNMALGNDGIIALSIDDAGPSLASIANDLLLACYGPRFSVRIVTQAETAKGDLKETFDLTVFDAEGDDEKSVRDMSGGERVWLNEALTRAMALYQAQQSGQSYECLFADESDGALDPERKKMFVAMKRKVLELGGYRQEIFISHTPELCEMADVQIDLGQFKVAA